MKLMELLGLTAPIHGQFCKVIPDALRRDNLSGVAVELAPAGTTHLERGSQAQGSGVAGDSAPSGHPG